MDSMCRHPVPVMRVCNVTPSLVLIWNEASQSQPGFNLSVSESGVGEAGTSAAAPADVAARLDALTAFAGLLLLSFRIVQQAKMT